MAKNLAEGMQRPLFVNIFVFLLGKGLTKASLWVLLTEELLFGVNLLCRIWMTLERESRIYCRN